MSTNISPDTSDATAPVIPAARKHSGKTHRTRLARTLATETGLGYQKCLGAVVAAAEAGALPDSLDKDGMAAAARILTPLVGAKGRTPTPAMQHSPVSSRSSLLFNSDRPVRLLISGSTHTGKTMFAKAVINDFRDAHPDGQVLVLASVDAFSSRYRVDEEPGLRVESLDAMTDEAVVEMLTTFNDDVVRDGRVGLVVTDCSGWLPQAANFTERVNAWTSVSVVLSQPTIFTSVRDFKGDVEWTHRVLTSPRSAKSGSGVFTEEWAEPVASTPASFFKGRRHSVMEGDGRVVRVEVSEDGAESFMGSEIGTYRFTDVVAFEEWASLEDEPVATVEAQKDWTDGERRAVLTGLRRMSMLMRGSVISEGALSALVADCAEPRAAALFQRMGTESVAAVISREDALFGSWAGVMVTEAMEVNKALGSLVDIVEKELVVAEAERRQQESREEMARLAGMGVVSTGTSSARLIR